MPQLTPDQLLARLDAITPAVRAQAGEGDRLARMPDTIVRELQALRLFRLWVPMRYDGFEMELCETLRIYEAAARIDGSFGWAVMIGAGGGLFAAYLDPPAAKDIFGPTEAVIAGSGAPDGWAEQTDGGYRVDGRWRYASGAHYATTFTANCVVTRRGQPVLDSQGKPLIRAMAFTPSQVEIYETWDTTGMRGTGSHDFEVKNAIVPQQHTFSVFTDTPREPGPLYRLPFGVLTELPIAALALGIARHALDAFTALARKKKAPDTDAPLENHPIAQTRLAESDARLRSLQSGIHTLAARTWQVALTNRSLRSRELSEITATCVQCLSDLNRAVADLASFAGMDAIKRDSEFARTWRDLQTLSAHVSVSPLRLMSAGRPLFSKRE
jgi:indole-3-acetate monooxygenase